MPVRSRPVSAKPVRTVCTWASTNAGATTAPWQVDHLVGVVVGRGPVVVTGEDDAVVLHRDGRGVAGPTAVHDSVAEQGPRHACASSRPSNSARTPAVLRSSSMAYAAWPGT